MYKLSAANHRSRSNLGMFAAGTMAIVDRLANRCSAGGAAFTEEAPAGITNPAVAPDNKTTLKFSEALARCGKRPFNFLRRDFYGYVGRAKDLVPVR